MTDEVEQSLDVWQNELRDRFRYICRTYIGREFSLEEIDHLVSLQFTIEAQIEMELEGLV